MDLVLTEFTQSSLYEVMKLMQSTDLFMGMHGAGFTNVLFLPPVRQASGSKIEGVRVRVGAPRDASLGPELVARAKEAPACAASHHARVHILAWQRSVCGRPVTCKRRQLHVDVDANWSQLAPPRDAMLGGSCIARRHGPQLSFVSVLRTLGLVVWRRARQCCSFSPSGG